MKKKNISVFSIIVFTFLCIWAISFFALIIWGFLSSFKDPLLDFRNNQLGFPKEWKFSNYLYVYNNFYVPITIEDGSTEYIGMFQQVLNSIIFCSLRSFFATFTPCLVGYLVAKYNYKFSGVFYMVAVVVMALPIVGAYPAEISLLTTLRIYDSWIGLCLQSSTYLGLYFFVFMASFKAIPNDFYEAASLDGCSEWGIFFKIMLPMVFSTCTTVFLLLFVASWNDYQFALLYLPSYPTLSYGLHVLSNSPLQDLNNVPMRMAGCLTVMLPILIVFIFVRDKLMLNVSLGGLKE